MGAVKRVERARESRARQRPFARRAHATDAPTPHAEISILPSPRRGRGAGREGASVIRIESRKWRVDRVEAEIVRHRRMNFSSLLTLLNSLFAKRIGEGARVSWLSIARLNVEHRTSNFEHRMTTGRRDASGARSIRRWTFNVRCSMFISVPAAQRGPGHAPSGGDILVRPATFVVWPFLPFIRARPDAA